MLWYRLTPEIQDGGCLIGSFGRDKILTSSFSESIILDTMQPKSADIENERGICQTGDDLIIVSY